MAASPMRQRRVTFNVIDSPGGNDAPDAGDDVFHGVEDQSINGNVLADNGNGADRDPNGDALSVTNQTISTAHGGRVAISANGDFVYTPATDYNGADTFTYVVKDVFGASSTGTVTLNLDPLNDAPRAVNDTVPATSPSVVVPTQPTAGRNSWVPA